MSYKDMFRKEQRFSFRKFSFGLASAVIANVIWEEQSQTAQLFMLTQ
ncbi:MAG: YSIRK-type signal peptide-containing protein [Streptococcus suis]|nr:YSIRK-type signal peptide-containing protein [Streptococcus suis]MDY5054404.1 YSIRK-type signal peptide-containing protein [Streptococcus suis]